MARLNMILVTLLPFLLWAALVVAQIPNIDRAGPKLNANHAINDAYQRPSSLSSSPKQPPVTPPKLGVYTSQGCFGSVPDNITSLRSVHNSPQWCYQECRLKGKNVMLLKSKWCHCADNYPAKVFALPDEKCHIGCREDADVACGGIRSVSVYNMGLELDVSFDPFTPEQRPAQEPLPGKITSQGCFSQLPRQFTLFSDRNMTPSMCHDKCKGRQFSVMMINDDKCYCAGKYPTKQSLLPDDRCNLPCPGKPLFVCGSPGAYSVFNLGRNLGVDHDSIISSKSNGQVIEQQPKPLATSKEPVSRGCFKQLPRDAVRVPIRAFSSRYFLKDCAKRCQNNGKQVAMLQGSKCHCANTYPPKTALVNDDLCKVPCLGSPDQMCGGISDMYTAYLTGLSHHVLYQIGPSKRPPRQIPFEEPIAGQMTSHGCYSLSPRQGVATPKGRKSTNMAPSCSKMCERLRKPVALTQKYKCLCSDTYPMLSTRVDDRLCDVACPGYPPEACGGHGTWSVMNTGLNVSVADDEEEAKASELPKLPFYGCFDELPESSRMVNQRSFNRQAQGDSCTYTCATKGYPVALRRGSDCHCSRSYPPPSSRVNETKCWFECPKDAREMCGGPLVWNVYRTRLDWPMDDDLEDQSTSAVTRPWKCSHPVIQRVKKATSWVMSEGTVIVYRIAWAFCVVFEEVKQFVIYIVNPLRWIWDGVAEVMDL
ncbi:hypothetical protein CEP53_005202 [Fusarium sp. AF-6]|nr:hypothetical protein CEP53_005202 [Fusarium sp. AF-6]